jgi:hypothetical protein
MKTEESKAQKNIKRLDTFQKLNKKFKAKVCQRMKE